MCSKIVWVFFFFFFFSSIIEICSKKCLEAAENCHGVERTWLGLRSRGQACDPPAPATSARQTSTCQFTRVRGVDVGCVGALPGAQLAGGFQSRQRGNHTAGGQRGSREQPGAGHHRGEGPVLIWGSGEKSDSKEAPECR